MMPLSSPVDPLFQFALRILIIIALWTFIGVAIWYMVRERDAAPAWERMQPALLVRLNATGRDASGAGSRYAIGVRATVWIGRDPNCVVRIDNEFVSQRHARLIWHPDQHAWWIEDHNSHNGVLVNDVLVMRSLLTTSDIISIGGVRFRFEIDPPQS